MTDNEIIKGLERMTEEDPEGFSSEILDLINRQKAEIEKLTVNMNAYGLAGKRLAEENEKLKAEIIRLEKHELSEAMKFNANTVKNIYNEAIEEFAERLKELLGTELSWCECVDEIIKPLDNLVKEMTGGE